MMIFLKGLGFGSFARQTVYTLEKYRNLRDLNLIKRAMSDKKRPVVYVTRIVPQKGVDLLSEKCEVRQWKSSDPVPREEFLKQVAGVDAFFCLLTEKIDAEVLDAAGPNLKAIGSMAVGFDHVDLAECKKRNIPVGFTPNVLTDATAELTVSILLAASRRIVEGAHEVKSGGWGTWDPCWLLGQGLHNSTVGLIGTGRIGQAVMNRLVPFRPRRFLFSDKYESDACLTIGEYVEMDTLLTEADFVISCTNLTPETTRMFNKNTFAKMKSNAILVNSSRGPVVDMMDLYEALKSGQIRAAALDVTVPEPLPPSHPLLTLKNLVVVPHIGSATEEARTDMATLTARNILAVLEGKEMPAQLT
ncbi:glyoxylate reductase/hydroxypyruvate reductase-like [Lineus longissimus]|uniref:glyoxylate reductase/hydroxypyruvate reductase-like n=1 Tax=Lineus longissimus TaxID=88925 RepID=UPI002B4CC706